MTLNLNVDVGEHVTVKLFSGSEYEGTVKSVLRPRLDREHTGWKFLFVEIHSESLKETHTINSESVAVITRKSE